MSNATKQNTVVVSSGNVEYDMGSTAVPINDLIDALEMAKENGAEYVTGLSGNSRGAKYMYVEIGELETVEDML